MPHCCSDHEKDVSDRRNANDLKKTVSTKNSVWFKNPWLVSSVILLTLLIFTQLLDVNFKFKNRNSNYKSESASTETGSSDIDINSLREQVVPKDGFTLSLKWGDLGPRVLKAGAIDLEKFKNIYERSGAPLPEEYLKILTQGSDDYININFDNSRFIVNFFWALGLAQKSKILDEGPMRTTQTPTENFASTGGWDLGSVETMDFYSKHQIVNLTSTQEELVEEVTSHVYRPCCGNPTSFPDCNHGMAALGVAEVLASQGFSKDEIFETLLKLNSFWFPDTYIKIAAYFEREGKSWDQVDPAEILSLDYSSARGAQEIARKVSDIPAFTSGGGSCGA